MKHHLRSWLLPGKFGLPLAFTSFYLDWHQVLLRWNAAGIARTPQLNDTVGDTDCRYLPPWIEKNSLAIPIAHMRKPDRRSTCKLDSLFWKTALLLFPARGPHWLEFRRGFCVRFLGACLTPFYLLLHVWQPLYPYPWMIP